MSEWVIFALCIGLSIVSMDIFDNGRPRNFIVESDRGGLIALFFLCVITISMIVAVAIFPVSKFFLIWLAYPVGRFAWFFIERHRYRDPSYPERARMRDQKYLADSERRYFERHQPEYKKAARKRSIVAWIFVCMFLTYLIASDLFRDLSTPPSGTEKVIGNLLMSLSGLSFVSALVFGYVIAESKQYRERAISISVVLIFVFFMASIVISPMPLID